MPFLTSYLALTLRIFRLKCAMGSEVRLTPNYCGTTTDGIIGIIGDATLLNYLGTVKNPMAGVTDAMARC